MSEPARSAALKRALAEEGDRLPQDFAAHVTGLAEAGSAARIFSWTDVVLLGAFVAMVGACVAGWSAFGTPDFSLHDLPVPPWLVIGIAGVAVVQLLTFGRRASP